jgi:predicted RNA-binding Zn-ribbon protein involved in translation (DUF1610 family)
LPIIKELLDTFKKMKFSSPKPVLCPKCGGYKIGVLQNYGILPSIYSCKECGYEGTIIIELQENLGSDDNSRLDESI